MNPPASPEQFAIGLLPHERRIEEKYLAKFAQGFSAWQIKQVGDLPANAHCLFLQEHILVLSSSMETARQQHAEYSRRISTAENAGDTPETKLLLAQYATLLGASAREVWQDQRALKRWFGLDALSDRFTRQQSHLERELALALRQLGRLAALFLQGDAIGAMTRWQSLRLEEIALPLFAYTGNVQVRIDAFVCLASAVATLPKEQQEGALSAEALQFISRSSLDRSLNIWIQCAALKLLHSLAKHEFAKVVRRRLSQPQAGDDLFVRRRIVDALVAQAPAELSNLLRLACLDPSPYVRQGVVLALCKIPVAKDALLRELYPSLLLQDAEEKVRAQAALGLIALSERASANLPVRQWLAQAILEERSAFVLRVLLRSAEQCVINCAERDDSKVQAFLLALNQPIHMLHQAAEYKVRRWAAQTAEVLWLYSDARMRAVLPDLRDAVARCKPSHSVQLGKQFNSVSAARLGRMLAVLTQRDYGVSLELSGNGWRLWRGDKFGFRLWRWLHEWRHPSPDKRQAFNHTIGRIFRGQVRVPSGILAEMSETKVPGEPLQLDSEAGWRPYLPLADELISALDEDFNSEPLRIYTAEGVTLVRAPRGLLARVKAKAWLSLNFSRLAQLRNWREESQAKPDGYLQQVAKLGFEVSMTPHQYSKSWRWALDPAVGRFFALPPLFLMGEHWSRFENYFFSAYDNTLFDLALFTALGLGLFTANHIYQNWKMARARKAIPLVVGGWGTRGKSGTERIKAALFNGLGYSVVSKTTGCEAMFLHGHPFADLREMFLFRPYDKATIWEQHHLVSMSPKLGCEVFLWECMALTPEFVQLLQRSWMRDDISTITNTIPDHEDLQGPAGINIPQVMTNFIPPKGIVITSEEQMRPILRSAADKLQTEMVGVGWLESGLLAPDVLARFPYQEHPDNIALVLAMGRELGVAEDFALKEMADRVVPDLGVLKTYPVAQVAGRKLSFVNGMSANERFGCLGNWTRLGFHQMDYEQSPGQYISTVVNNRGDRIARSRVFANILVEDLRADKHFLIGSNLAGLQGYIREAWDAHAQGISLWPQALDGARVPPEQVLANFARHMRVIFLPQQLQNQLRAMLEGQNLGNYAACLEAWQDAEQLTSTLQACGCQLIPETLAFVEQAQQSMQEYQAFAQRLANAEQNEALDNAFRDLLWLWYSRKLVVVTDYYASGDSIIELLAQHTPPGCENKVMGIQNIKGTGLGFIYCWQAWDACYLACKALESRDSAEVERGLTQLLRMQNFGLLSELAVQQALQKALRHLQNERQQAQLAQISANLQKALEQVRAKMGNQASSGRLEKLCSNVEGFFDGIDAVLRRRKANQIYKDLASQRISHSRAALELQGLTQRQKGGWLYQALK